MTRKGPRIVVTGVSSGIGAAVASLLAEEGATVLGVDRTRPSEEPNGGFVPCDVGDPDSLGACVRRLPESIDGLANVAGLPGTADPNAIGRVNFSVSALSPRCCIHVSRRAGPSSTSHPLPVRAGPVTCRRWRS